MQDERLQRWRLPVASVLALLLHAAVAFGGLARLLELSDFARWVQAGMQQRRHANIQVALEPEPEPPPPEAPKPEAAPEPAPQPPPKAPAPKAPTRPPEPAAPAAAQAGHVLTAEPDPDEPVDLTGAFVQGNADSYAGGVTASNGTAAHAVRAPTARAEGVPGGTGTAPAGPDRSRPPRVLSQDWDCPFPPGEERINYAVRVVVKLSAKGKVLDARALATPNQGYARAAERCALGKGFEPALDRSGAEAATTIPIVVNFTLR